MLDIAGPLHSGTQQPGQSAVQEGAGTGSQASTLAQLLLTVCAGHGRTIALMNSQPGQSTVGSGAIDS